MKGKEGREKEGRGRRRRKSGVISDPPDRK
jgi:hypothetical protein